MQNSFVYDHPIMEYLDIEVHVKERKTIRDVFTVAMAIDSGKSSKDHKLKPRSTRRDRTRSEEAKRASLKKMKRVYTA